MTRQTNVKKTNKKKFIYSTVLILLTVTFRSYQLIVKTFSNVSESVKHSPYTKYLIIGISGVILIITVICILLFLKVRKFNSRLVLVKIKCRWYKKNWKCKQNIIISRLQKKNHWNKNFTKKNERRWIKVEPPLPTKKAHKNKQTIETKIRDQVREWDQYLTHNDFYYLLHH